MVILMPTFGERLHTLRKEQNITADSLADSIGVKRRIIFLYEKDEAKPSYDVLLTLSNYFSVSLDFLTGRTDNPRHEDFVDKAEAFLLEELEKLSALGVNAEFDSKEELLGVVGSSKLEFYKRHASKYQSPLARLALIFRTRIILNEQLNPKTIDVHLVVPKDFRKASIFSPKEYLTERGLLPHKVPAPALTPFSKKSPVAILLEKCDELEKEYLKQKNV